MQYLQTIRNVSCKMEIRTPTQTVKAVIRIQTSMQTSAWNGNRIHWPILFSVRTFLMENLIAIPFPNRVLLMEIHLIWYPILMIFWTRFCGEAQMIHWKLFVSMPVIVSPNLKVSLSLQMVLCRWTGDWIIRDETLPSVVHLVMEIMTVNSLVNH